MPERRLFDIRNKRVHPLKDDKILTSWNGLMIAALAKGYQALGDEAFADAARKAADFILKKSKNRQRQTSQTLQKRGCSLCRVS